MILNNFRDIYDSKVLSLLLIIVQILPVMSLLKTNTFSRLFISKKIAFFVLFSSLIIFVKTQDANDLFLWTRWFILPVAWYMIGKGLSREYDKVTPMIYSLFTVGVVLAFLKHFILGWHGEKPLGLIGHSGSTYVILVSFMMFISSIVLNQELGKNRRTILGILYVASCFIMMIASGKRTVLFLIPVLSILTLFKSKVKLKHILLAITFFGISLFALLNNSTLNVDGKSLEAYDFLSVYNYVMDYEDFGRVDEQGNTVGRSGTIIRVVQNFKENPYKLLVGENDFFLGIDDTTKRLGISYGLTGFILLLMNVGFPLTLLYFSFLYSGMRDWGKTPKTAHLSGSSWVILILMVFYSPEFINPTLASILYLLIGYFNEEKSRYNWT